MTFGNVLVVILIIILFFLFKDKFLSLLSDKPSQKRKEKEEEKDTYPPPPTKKTETAILEKKPETEKRLDKKDSAPPRTDEYTKAKVEVKAEAPKKPMPIVEPEVQEIIPEVSKKPEVTKKPEELVPEEPIHDIIPEPFTEPVVAKDFPPTKYTNFDNSRLLDMGLSQEDANTFTIELIKQFDDQMPQIETAINEGDYENIEHLTHSIKGSSSNLGTGGVADVVTDFNTYIKTGKDKEIISAHMNNMKKYLSELKEEFQ
ncbi:MAG: Hpt domain-containing protein [Campylobacterota bacterium]|nr:Hpt domain-containing protein [Campylobacterota bacterium]